MWIVVAVSSMFFHIRSLRSDDCGAVNVIMGVLLVPLIGALGIGFEVSNWSMRTRGMQNAADAAALAAATNNSSNYDVEAKAVAARYGNQSLKQARGGSKFQEKARRARPVCQLRASSPDIALPLFGCVAKRTERSPPRSAVMAIDGSRSEVEQH
ncbi:pilus assembly protein TadG-related protein [Bradyrhizobium australafricanum]|uniref:pilus assembly protein TadG-related protein n=1 Tax=Bradyrhizobium australafricanum TaxID=2821406 RepID=UPI001CE393C8|nr:pilus assembly protein TadG-related protein [Bradyrhizobium australafricanum]MCA6104647.1 hypothetical protein [Bradyrhizobium australafricanum]